MRIIERKENVVETVEEIAREEQRKRKKASIEYGKIKIKEQWYCDEREKVLRDGRGTMRGQISGERTDVREEGRRQREEVKGGRETGIAGMQREERKEPGEWRFGMLRN